MGTTNNGLLGPATGKLKHFVFYQLGCKSVVRTIGKRQSAATAGETRNTSKMRTLMSLFSMKLFLKAGYSSAASGTALNYHNLATSINRLNLSGLEEGLQQLSYDKLQLSMGDAEPPEAAVVTIEAGGLRFNWNWRPEDFKAGEDQVMMMAYLPDQNSSVFETAGAKRRKEADFLPLQPAFLQERIEVFMSFVSSDRMRASNSTYLGRIN